jgi:hypothetical protein
MSCGSVFLTSLLSFKVFGTAASGAVVAVKITAGRGFKSHPVHFITLDNYGIILSSFSVIVGQNLYNTL